MLQNPQKLSLRENTTPQGLSNPVILIPGVNNKRNCSVEFDEDILSKHVLLIGSTGCGKTNVFNHIVKQLKQNMNADDIMLIFDTKGDFHSKFFDGRKDLVIGNSDQYKSISKKWNIFKEVLADGDAIKTVDQNAQEIASSIFNEAIENGKNQPFFPNAAKDLFASIICTTISLAGDDKNLKNEYFNNEALRKRFDCLDIEFLSSLLGSDPHHSSVLTYIGDGSNNQGLGVLAEMQNIVRSTITGIFAEKGMFSIREFVRNKGGRALFVEYDLAKGELLTPIYRLLFDLALKEALGRETDGGKKHGNVYFICDEFKLLPHLQHIDDGVNFGRSLGIKVIAGIQSINQLYDNYGEYKGRNIAAGFSSVLSFRANDAETRKFIIERYGQMMKKERSSLSAAIVEERRIGNVVEDWDMTTMSIGEAVVGLAFKEPFLFKFDIYR